MKWIAHFVKPLTSEQKNTLCSIVFMHNTPWHQIKLLGLIWTSILLLMVGRSVWIDAVDSELWFHCMAWCLGLVLYPLQIRFIKWQFQTIEHWGVIIAIHLTLAVLFGGMYHYFASSSMIIQETVVPNGMTWEGVVPKTGQFYPGQEYSVFFLYFFHAGIALLLTYHERLKEKELREVNLRGMLATSQLKALQAELQPHFIFNTLNAVSSLMEEDTAQAQCLMEKFSFLLRSYLDIINRQFYTLRDEIEFLQEYIEVQRLRSTTGITFQADLDDDCLNTLVPVIFLQPIIENSIKHGWKDRHSRFTIQLACSASEGKISITIQDSGAATEQIIKEGVGLRNLRERLGVMFKGFEFEYSATPQGFRTILIIPCQQSQVP